MNQHILVVDDEAVTRNMVGSYFEKVGYQVSHAASGAEMREQIAEHQIDLVLLDINLPDQDGLTLARELRTQSDIGIILITSRTDSIDRIVGLEMGADDYASKPLELRELQVRVKNLLWRMSLAHKMPENTAPLTADKQLVRFGKCVFDVKRRALVKDGLPVKLTKAEFEMLVAFTENPNKVLSRERILNMISHRVDAPNDRTIDVLIRRLRNKIETEPKKPQLFITVHGEGYMFTS
ncbi:two-component system response regulator TorR [Veronia pacifica]|uniref:DNA-binding response regulator n=1 Tax=Veronia pacifica TaxID=1080227 RepID=A0A1C3EBY5_9GAMM|nr:two-component system response regulator TorR [Veronia pacifica]ODA30704.1 DNA-binding response regulator [Veronia pacifica]